MQFSIGKHQVNIQISDLSRFYTTAKEFVIKEAKYFANLIHSYCAQAYAYIAKNVAPILPSRVQVIKAPDLKEENPIVQEAFQPEKETPITSSVEASEPETEVLQPVDNKPVVITKESSKKGLFASAALILFTAAGIFKWKNASNTSQKEETKPQQAANNEEITPALLLIANTQSPLEHVVTKPLSSPAQVRKQAIEEGVEIITRLLVTQNNPKEPISWDIIHKSLKGVHKRGVSTAEIFDVIGKTFYVKRTVNGVFLRPVIRR